MRRLAVAFFLLLAVLLLFSCSPTMNENNVNNHTSDYTPRARIISAHDALRNRVSEIISKSLPADKKDISSLLFGAHSQSNMVLDISRLALLKNEIIKPTDPLRITLDTIKDRETAGTQSTITLNYSDESLAFVNYSTENGNELLIPALTEAVLLDKDALSFDALSKDIYLMLSSEETDNANFNVERTNYRKGSTNYHSVTAVSLNTGSYHSIITSVTAYFDNDSPFALSYTTFSGITVDFFFPEMEDDTDKLCVSAEKCTTDGSTFEKIFYLSFTQKKLNTSDTSGHIYISADTEALSHLGISIPGGITEVKIDSVFDTELSGARSNCMTINHIEYTVHGIKSSHDMPIHILSEFKNGSLSSTVRLRYSGEELTAFEGTLTVNTSVSTPHTVISRVPLDNVKDASVSSEKNEYILSAEATFFGKYPKISSLLPYDVQKNEGPGLSIISAFSPETDRKYILYYDGSGEYNGYEITDILYEYRDGKLIATDSSGTIEILVTSEDTGYDIAPDTSFVITDNNGNILSKSEGEKGTLTVGVILKVISDDGNGSAVIDLLYSDGTNALSGAKVSYGDGKASFTYSGKTYTFVYTME